MPYIRYGCREYTIQDNGSATIQETVDACLRGADGSGSQWLPAIDGEIPVALLIRGGVPIVISQSPTGG